MLFGHHEDATPPRRPPLSPALHGLRCDLAGEHNPGTVPHVERTEAFAGVVQEGGLQQRLPVAVGDQVASDLVAALKVRIARLRIGPGNEPESEMGPLISAQHVAKVGGYVGIGADEGADVLIDGRTQSDSQSKHGYFIGASLLDRVTPDMRVHKEEIFGPVLSISRCDSLDDAITLLNGHEYGNGAAIFTSNGEAARRFTREVLAGMIGVNVPIPVPVAYHSFGGWKRSLFGDHHMHGQEGVRFFTRLKTISTRWPKTTAPQEHYAMPTLD